MRFVRYFALLAAGLVLAGCNAKEMLAPDPEAKKVAEVAYVQLVRGDMDALFAGMPDEVRTTQHRRLAAALREVVPEGPAQSGKIVGVTKNSTTSGKTQVLTYDYDYGTEKVRFSATMQRKTNEEPWTVVGFNVAPAADDAAGFDFGQVTSLPPARPAAAPVSKAPGDSESASGPASSE